ncbi:MAG: DUF3168 domain-containing protein [Paracoccaceae bacterium]
MSYGMAAPLQEAVFQLLQGDAVLAGLVGTDIFDAAPAGAVPTIYVSLGPEDVRDRADQTGTGARHEFTVSVVSQAAGFKSAKQAAGAVSDALLGSSLVLTRGRVVSMNFLRAIAKRVQDADVRRIDLRFVARLEDV